MEINSIVTFLTREISYYEIYIKRITSCLLREYDCYRISSIQFGNSHHPVERKKERKKEREEETKKEKGNHNP